ncbi:hypothetical protein AAG906_028115 [Vitis piasezkii]
MVDFIVKLPKKQVHPVDRPREQWWTLHVDGVSGSEVVLILQSPISELMEQVIRLIVLVGLDLALTLIATKLEIRSDSQLIVGQIQREYEAKDECMARYLTMMEDHLKKLNEWVIRWVNEKKN